MTFGQTPSGQKIAVHECGEMATFGAAARAVEPEESSPRDELLDRQLARQATEILFKHEVELASNPDN